MICKIARTFSQAVAVVSLLSGLTSVQAVSITVNNFSFEDRAPLADGAFLAAIPQWTIITGNGGEWNPKNNATQMTLTAMAGITGNNVGYLNGASSMFQQLAAPFLPNTEYKLEADFFSRLPVGVVPPPNNFKLYLTTGLGAGQVVLSSVTGTIPLGNFVSLQAIYVTGAVAPVGVARIWIENLPWPGSPTRQLDFDNVRISTSYINPTPVPDGGSVTWIVGLGLGAFASFRRSQKK